MRLFAVLLVSLAASGCVSTPRDLASDPDVPRLSLHYPADWLAAYQAINAGVTRCDSWDIKAAQDDAAQRGSIVVSAIERIGYMFDVRADGSGSIVTVTMPMHAGKQRRAWPVVLDRWINQGDRTTCARDVL